MRRAKKLLILVMVLLSISAITGCGGGEGTTPAQPPTPPPGPATTNVSVSGVVGLSGFVGTSVKKSQTGVVPIANAIVEIIAYNKNNEETGRATTATLSTGTFNAPITLSNNGGYIVINITGVGFADYSKRIDFEKPADVNIQAILDEVVTAIAKRTDAVFSASTGKKVIKFGLFKTARGQKVIKVGRDVDLRKQQGENPTLEITIPVDSIPTEVNTLVAQLQTFNPIEEADRFPGQYRDSNGNRIVSLGFDFINITDDRGINLGTLTTQAVRQGKLKKAEEEETRITRQIPPGVCKNLLRDVVCAETDSKGRCKKVKEKNDLSDGFQVPVYTYNPIKGEWDLLGIGTLDVNGDGVFDENDPLAVGDIFPVNNPDGVIDHKDYQQYCKNKEEKGAYLYLIITITNEDFIANWWNLDYPLIFEEPKELCIIKTFKDNTGKPIEGLWTYLYDDDQISSFSPVWGSTDPDGNVRLNTVLTDSTDPDRTAKIGFSNPFDWLWMEETVTLGESPNCTSKTNTITKPKMCQVEGYVKDEEGRGVADQYVYAYGVGTWDYRYAYTDNNGYFIMDVRCETDYNLYTGWSWEPSRVFNVNNSTTDSEEKDDGNKVTLKDIILLNQAPYAYGWLSSSSIFTGGTIIAYIYGWDNECDKPMNWSIMGAPSEVKDTANDCWFYEEREIEFTSPGTYTLSLSVTDSKGKTGTAHLGTVYVTAANSNRPPVILYAYPERYSAEKGTPITLYGSAYDLDGNNLSWRWYANNSLISGCSGSAGSSIFTNCSYTTPGVDGPVNIKFEVSDGVDTVSEDFNISVGSTGGLDIIIQKKRR